MYNDNKTYCSDVINHFGTYIKLSSTTITSLEYSHHFQDYFFLVRREDIVLILLTEFSPDDVPDDVESSSRFLVALERLVVRRSNLSSVVPSIPDDVESSSTFFVALERLVVRRSHLSSVVPFSPDDVESSSSFLAALERLVVRRSHLTSVVPFSAAKSCFLFFPRVVGGCVGGGMVLSAGATITFTASVVLSLLTSTLVARDGDTT
mmetsp:Transcript_15254/g.22944  ORF Transcript_15254/g.22944 Transcript_15254/m.22944 type:complete len:207 (-) Transcript_15254:359-979(-)